MPICLSQNRRFRGIFSQRELVWNAIKILENLEGQDDELLSDRLMIRASSGRTKIGDDCFCRFTYQTLCRELRSQTRIALFDPTGENFLYAIWLTPINEIYYTPSELSGEDQNQGTDQDQVPDQTQNNASPDETSQNDSSPDETAQYVVESENHSKDENEGGEKTVS